MLYSAAAILLMAWLFGLVGAQPLDPFVHLRLVVAALLFLGFSLQGRYRSYLLGPPVRSPHLMEFAASMSARIPRQPSSAL